MIICQESECPEKFPSWLLIEIDIKNKAFLGLPWWSIGQEFTFHCTSVHGILQAALLEWVAVSFSSRSSSPRDQTHVSCISCIVVDSLSSEPLGKSMRPWGLIISSLIWFSFQTNTLVFPIYFSPHFVLFHDILELFLFSSYISFLKCVKLQG